MRLTWCKRTALQEHVTKSKCDMCRECQKVGYVKTYIFSAAQNGATEGTAMTKSVRAFHARASVLTMKTTAGVDVTRRPSLAVYCQQSGPAHCRSVDTVLPDVLSCLQPSSERGLVALWTSVLQASLSLAIWSSWPIPHLVHDVMLLIQDVPGLPCLRVPGMVPSIMSFSRHSPSSHISGITCPK